MDASGRLVDGRQFDNIHDLKALLRDDSRQLARNLLNQFTVYATGTPVRFGDRAEIESILDACANNDYLVRDLMMAAINSRIFLGNKPGDGQSMNGPHISTASSHLPRRAFLQGMGVSLALPALECMRPVLVRAATPDVAPRRMLVIVNNLGLLPKYFATGMGRDYKPSPYLELLSDVRDEFTVFSGLSHPGVDGAQHRQLLPYGRPERVQIRLSQHGLTGSIRSRTTSPVDAIPYTESGSHSTE